ncbi:hypothetical protein [Chryseobacterium lineare]
MKNLFYALTLLLLLSIPIDLSAQNSIKINGERILTKDFLADDGNYFNRMAYNRDNLYISPFFGQENPIKLKESSLTEVAYSVLGYLCPEADRGLNVIDYKSPSEFLPLYSTKRSDENWDKLIFNYFTDHSDDIPEEFMQKWNSSQFSSTQMKRELLMKPENKAIKDLFFSKFLDEENTAEYSQKTKKEIKMNLKIEADIRADLDKYLKSISADNQKANTIKAEAQISIDKKLKNNNNIEIKYYRVKLNGTFYNLVNKFAENICEKKNKSLELSNFEKDFYKRYMDVYRVFLITHMQYISYKFDKTKVTNVVNSIVMDIDASMKNLQMQGLEVDFGVNLNYKVEKETNSVYKSNGGYILQIAENAQVGSIDGKCK